MGVYMPAKVPDSPLFSKTRRAVLSLLVGHPDERFYLRQIVDHAGVGVGGVQRELQVLTDAGILRRTKEGMHVYYQADPSSPIYEELRGIVLKTLGVVPLLHKALNPLKDRIWLAFVYGSVAEGQETNISDVDVMVVGDVSFGEVVGATSDLQDQLRREVNPTVYTDHEFQKKIADGHHFLTQVLNGKKLLIIGDEDDISELV